MPTEQFLNNLIINKVDTAETYEAMKANDLVNENEIYLIENPVANMTKSVYDPQGKNTDIFAYVDNAIGAAISASY